MTDHPNAARYREIMKSTESGDFRPMMDSIAPDVEWWEMGATDAIHGRDAVAARMSGWMGDTEMSVDLHDVLANDEHLVAMLKVHATRGDETFHYNVVEVNHINSDGQVAERWAFSDDTQRVIDYFG